MLTVLIDSWEYVNSNCYQHQLIKMISNVVPDVNFLELHEIHRYKDGPVLSCLKLRTLDRSFKKVKDSIRNNVVLVYDQDPWENFIVSSPYFQSYDRISSTLNVKSFLNTSSWWSDQVNQAGFRSTFVNLWILPEYCNHSVLWENKVNDIVFCGTLYPRRIRFFDELSSNGINVKVHNSSLNYRDYLKFVTTCKIMIRSEKVDWNVRLNNVSQEITVPNALWIRDVECASQGCFSMRESDSEKTAWELDIIPSIVSFSSAKHAVEMINSITNMSSDEANEKLQSGSDAVKNVNKLRSTVQTIVRLINEKLRNWLSLVCEQC